MGVTAFIQNMLSRSTIALAITGSAAAFAPIMSMDMGRREIVKIAGAGAVAAPLLRGSEASASTSSGYINRSKFPGKAPVITVFDHRGCTAHTNKEYTGGKSGDQDDEMCVKVEQKKLAMNEAAAAKQLAESISLKAKGIDGDYTSAA